MHDKQEKAHENHSTLKGMEKGDVSLDEDRTRDLALHKWDLVLHLASDASPLTYIIFSPSVA